VRGWGGRGITMCNWDLVLSGLEKLDCDDGTDALLYLTATYGGWSTDAYDPQVALKALATLTPAEQEAVTDYVCYFCAIVGPEKRGAAAAAGGGVGVNA